MPETEHPDFIGPDQQEAVDSADDLDQTMILETDENSNHPEV